MFHKVSLVVLISGIGMVSALVYFYVMQPNSTNPISPRLSSDDTIRIVQDDINRWNSVDGKKYGVNYKITDIAVNPPKILNGTESYIPFEEFEEKGMKLPLIYISSNRTVLRIFENGSSENIGQCNTGLSMYCGYLPPGKLGYEDRLVYGVDTQALAKDDLKEPLFFLVDAKNGQIVDSSFIRSGLDIRYYFDDK